MVPNMDMINNAMKVLGETQTLIRSHLTQDKSYKVLQ